MMNMVSMTADALGRLRHEDFKYLHSQVFCAEHCFTLMGPQRCD